MTMPDDRALPGGQSSANDWIDAARGGSQAELGQLLDGCRRYMLLVANRLLDPQLQAKMGASDLVQETFVAATRDFAKFRGTTEEELHAWLTQILFHRISKAKHDFQVGQKRNVDRERPLDTESGLARLGIAVDETPSSVAAAQEQEEKLRQALARLPDHYREVIHLRNWQRLSFKELGTRTGRSADAARKLWGRAVERLRQELNLDP